MAALFLYAIGGNSNAGIAEYTLEPAGGEEIVRGVDLRIEPGRLTVITGPNGGGKTSLAKLIAGLENPTEGRILMNGEDITGLDITERARRGIAYAFQQPVRFKGLTVRNLLDLAAGQQLEEHQACALLGKVGLCAKEYLDRPVDASLSAARASESRSPPCWPAPTPACWCLTNRKRASTCGASTA